MHACICVLYVYMLYTCTSTCTYRVRLSVCLSTCVIMFKYVWVCDMCTVACFSDSDPFGEIRTGCRRPRPDLDSCRCGPDTMVIRRPTHGMIRISVPVCAVKTRRLFGSETASFHVSVRSCVLTIVGMHYSCSYHFMWLSVIFYQFDYLYHFMRHLWLFTLFT